IIVLKSSNGEAFEVDKVVASESQTIKHITEDDCADSEISLLNVTSRFLACLSSIIVLKSSNGEAFEVDKVVASESQTIKHITEDDCADSEILLLNVTSRFLA
ncbi:hypothetical protein RYX36_014195, partial [Vicia faba]